MPDTFTTIVIALAVVGFIANARVIILQERKKARDELADAERLQTPFGDIAFVDKRLCPTRHEGGDTL